MGSVMDKPFMIQLSSTVMVALIATFGVYGLVALIVRMDNIVFWLIEKEHTKSGMALMNAMPKVIKLLGFIGTWAMILVGGGILAHNVEFFHHYFIEALPGIVNELIIGLIVGFVVL